MDFNKKAERQYKKYESLCEAVRNEFDQRKADKAFAKLQDMFPDKESFNAFWNAKLDATLQGTTIRIVRN